MQGLSCKGALLAAVITVSLILRHCNWSGREKRNENAER
jgi:hypothetical protein